MLHNGEDFIDFLFCELSSPLGEVNISALAHKVGKTTTNALDMSIGADISTKIFKSNLNRGQSIDDVLFTINVRVQNTKDVLELLVFLKYE